MDPEVDIIEFQVPVENNKTLFVWDIQPSFTEAFIYERLWSVFSSFGPLYLLKVCPNAAVARPGFYALVKFYSAVQASKAQRSTDKQTLFQSTPVKVRLSTKQNNTYSNPHNIKPLSHARCQELANHCLGFNGWCTRILTLKELSSDPEDDQGRSQEEKTLRYGCLVELSFPQHSPATSRGVAVVEETYNNTGPEICGQKHSKLRRWVRDKAVVQAFSTVLVIMLGNGKVLIEVREDRDQLQPEDNPEGEIQVNEVCWSDLNPEQEEEDWELTVS